MDITKYKHYKKICRLGKCVVECRNMTLMSVPLPTLKHKDCGVYLICTNMFSEDKIQVGGTLQDIYFCIGAKLLLGYGSVYEATTSGKVYEQVTSAEISAFACIENILVDAGFANVGFSIVGTDWKWKDIMSRFGGRRAVEFCETVLYGKILCQKCLAKLQSTTCVDRLDSELARYTSRYKAIHFIDWVDQTYKNSHGLVSGSDLPEHCLGDLLHGLFGEYLDSKEGDK